MPQFEPKLQVPKLVVPPPAAKPAPTPASTGDALTLDALMERQKQIALSQGEAMKMPVQSNEQGFAQMAWALVNGLRARKAERELATGQQELANAFQTGFDPNTGEMTSEAMGVIARRNPELAAQMAIEAAQARRSAAKEDVWTPIATPPGENGQWFQNQHGDTKKVGGGSPGETGVKLSDLATLRGDYTGDTSYKNYSQAAPIWASITDANTRDTPQSDLNIVIGMAKLFDPTSVVRTQEGEAVQQTAGLPTELFSYYKYLTGQPGSRLDSYAPGTRKNLLREGYSRMQGYRSALEQHNKWISGIAAKHGIDPNDVVSPLPELAPFGEEPPADPNQPNPPPAATEEGGVPPRPAWLGPGDPWPNPAQWKKMTPEQQAAFTKWSQMTTRPGDF